MIRYTLVADGSSDQALLPIIDYTISQNFPELIFSGVAASGLPAPRYGLAVRLQAAMKMFPCELLFVHRDSEAQQPENRFQEIAEACQNIQLKVIPVVPVRMTEAWLLVSEAAIRKAAGNPAGRNRLQIPSLRRIEATTEPKEILFSALVEAANLGARKRANFDVNAKRRRVAECMEDPSILRQLPSYRRFETDLKEALEE